jgi:hypothetical protein
MFASGGSPLAPLLDGPSRTNAVFPHGSDQGRLRFSGNVLLLSQVDQMAVESPEGIPSDTVAVRAGRSIAWPFLRTSARVAAGAFFDLQV